jgi:eukaryotic translation initiation factor 2C
MNLKASGINHTTKYLEGVFSKTLVFGADATHPSSKSISGCPSIAAILGSVESRSGRYLGSMKLQDRENKEVSRDHNSRRHSKRTCADNFK